MSGTTTADVSKLPPFNDDPLVKDGQFGHAWARHLQDQALAVAGMRVGTTTNDNAKAGEIGEYLTATATGIVLTTNVTADIVVLALTAGDWDVCGVVVFHPEPTTVPRLVFCSIGAATLTAGTLSTALPAVFGTGQTVTIGNGGAERYSLAAPANVYLVGLSTFITAGMAADGFASARRVR